MTELFGLIFVVGYFAIIFDGLVQAFGSPLTVRGFLHWASFVGALAVIFKLVRETACAMQEYASVHEDVPLWTLKAGLALVVFAFIGVRAWRYDVLWREERARRDARATEQLRRRAPPPAPELGEERGESVVFRPRGQRAD